MHLYPGPETLNTLRDGFDEARQNICRSHGVHDEAEPSAVGTTPPHQKNCVECLCHLIHQF